MDKNMDRLNYWNHNTAYYPWIRKRLANCSSVLDVGCGDGALAFYLDDGSKEIVGIDVDRDCICRASLTKSSDRTEFICCGFEDYRPVRRFDAVVFVASIHHMDMTYALEKAKSLLAPDGKLLIVGLAKPSTAADYILEAVRVIPSKAVSVFHRMRSSEELSISTSYDFPQMQVIRGIVKEELPGARIRYGLHYRYLLEWTA